MNFASYDFWQLLIICFFGSQLAIALTKRLLPDYETTIMKVCLALTGLILLGAESWLTLIVFTWVVTLSWIGVLFATQTTQPSKISVSAVFAILLIGQLAPLFYYKYWNFFTNDLLGFSIKSTSVAIPMGLSFYTFQKIGFWIDTVRNPQTPPKLLDYLNFCSFFPQIVAGPIEKKETLLPQIEQIRYKFHWQHFNEASEWIVLGLAYKLIVADNIGNLAQTFQISSQNAYQIWFQCISFGIRIYFDFAGYSFIAVGLGLIVGVKLTMNFDCPYSSTNLRDFWRRWHITLGAWLRDYIYIPLGGKRCKWWIINTLAVFVISGLWHGAGIGFLIWGLMHGVGVAFSSLGKPLTRFPLLRWAVTTAYVTAAWLFFFESNLKVLSEKSKALISISAYEPQKLVELLSLSPSTSTTISLSGILLIAMTFLTFEAIGKHMNLQSYQLLRGQGIGIILLVLIVFLAPMEESQFIYFNF